MRRDIHSSVDLVTTMVPLVYSGPSAGVGVDLKGYSAAQAVIIAGAFTAAGTFTFNLQEADEDTALAYTNAAEDDLQGASKVPELSAGDQVVRIGYLGNKRFIRLAITHRASNPTLQAAGVIVRGLPGLAPLPE